LNSLFGAKGEGYPELQLVLLNFVNVSIDFYPKKAMEFTATAPVLSER